MEKFKQQFEAIKSSGEKDEKKKMDKTVEETPTQETIAENLPIQEDETAISYLGVKLEKAENQESPFVPKQETYKDYINDKFSLELQKKIAISFAEGDPILVEGGTSIGKTTTVKKMASELGWEVHYANLNGATDVEDLMGRYIPNPRKTKPEDPEYIFADGKVTSGLRREEGKIKVIILDELNAATPNILIRLHEILDALERDGDIVLSEDASETVAVNKTTTKVVALMNPPGKGYFGREPLDPAQLRRWVYQKETTDLPVETFSHSTDALFSLVAKTQGVSKEAFLASQEQAITSEQLAEISGITEVLAKYKEFHIAAKEMLKQRQLAEDQPQQFSFDDRMEPKRVRDFVMRFYFGDINETFQEALRYYYAGKLESDEDRQKLEELIQHVEYIPKTESKRKGVERGEEDAEGVKKETPKSKIEGTVAEQIETAEKKLGKEKVFGPKKIEDALGIVVEDIPEIQFTKKELEMIRDNDEHLILEIPNLTMKNIRDIIKERADTDEMKRTGGLRFLNVVIEKKYFDKNKTILRWKAVSNNSELGEGQTAPIQLKTLIDTLEARYGGELPDKYKTEAQKFRNEFAQKIAEVTNLSESEIASKTDSEIDKAIYDVRTTKEARKKLVSWLENSEIAKLITPTVTEYFYDFAIRYLSAKSDSEKVRLQEDYKNYSRIYQSTSPDYLVVFGGLGSDGVSADDWSPGNRNSDDGASFSRS